ncbi:hypothetical protein D3C72_2152930 [compost metagenome]
MLNITLCYCAAVKLAIIKSGYVKRYDIKLVNPIEIDGWTFPEEIESNNCSVAQAANVKICIEILLYTI